MTKTEATEKMIKRYTAKGGNESTGRRILAEEIRRFAPDNLATALVYWNFATTITADKLAAVVSE